MSSIAKTLPPSRDPVPQKPRVTLVTGISVNTLRAQQAVHLRDRRKKLALEREKLSLEGHLLIGHQGSLYMCGHGIDVQPRSIEHSQQIEAWCAAVRDNTHEILEINKQLDGLK